MIIHFSNVQAMQFGLNITTPVMVAKRLSGAVKLFGGKKRSQTMKTYLIINEQHNLLPEQSRILRDRFGAWIEMRVPASGA